MDIFAGEGALVSFHVAVVKYSVKSDCGEGFIWAHS